MSDAAVVAALEDTVNEPFRLAELRSQAMATLEDLAHRLECEQCRGDDREQAWVRSLFAANAHIVLLADGFSTAVATVVEQRLLDQPDRPLIRKKVVRDERDRIVAIDEELRLVPR